MNRKGQAVVEFLMTYGWAILFAIFAIGVLAYFGVFSPGQFTIKDDRCMDAFNISFGNGNTLLCENYSNEHQNSCGMNFDCNEDNYRCFNNFHKVKLWTKC